MQRSRRPANWPRVNTRPDSHDRCRSSTSNEQCCRGPTKRATGSLGARFGHDLARLASRLYSARSEVTLATAVARPVDNQYPFLETTAKGTYEGRYPKSRPVTC